MNRKFFMAAMLFASLLAGCSADSGGPGAAEAISADGQALVSQPIQAVDLNIEYDVLGNPVVGQPVAVSLQVRVDPGSGPVTLSYRESESGSLTFPESQAGEIAWTPREDEPVHTLQVTVVPQREGRVYLNVSAKLQAALGSAYKAIAIPILVEGAPKPAREIAPEAEPTEEPDPQDTPQ